MNTSKLDTYYLNLTNRLMYISNILPEIRIRREEFNLKNLRLWRWTVPKPSYSNYPYQRSDSTWVLLRTSSTTSSVLFHTRYRCIILTIDFGTKTKLQFLSLFSIKCPKWNLDTTFINKKTIAIPTLWSKIFIQCFILEKRMILEEKVKRIGVFAAFFWFLKRNSWICMLL